MIRLRAEWLAPVDRPPIPDAGVVIHANRIVDLGPTEVLARRHPDAVATDLGSVVLTAGFVDTHCHVEWSLSSMGAPCRGDFAGWLAAIMRRGSTMTPDDFAVSARLGVMRALLAGTTCMLDAGPTGAGAAAADEFGLRAHVHLEVFGRLDRTRAAEVAADLAPRVAALDSGLVRGGVSPHAPYTVSPDLWRELAAHPDLSTRPWMTHVAESAQELPAIAGSGGPLADLFAARDSAPGYWPGTGSVIQRLRSNGALRPGLVAAHCVHADVSDRATLAACGVGVAHCPVANAVLDVGTHDLAATRGAGVSVALGSDSPATAGAYDVRSIARACAATDPHDLLRLITLEGARVAGRDHELGSVTPGKLADLTAVAITPGSVDPVDAMFVDGATVRFSMVDGQVVVDEGRIVRSDPERVNREAATATARLNG